MTKRLIQQFSVLALAALCSGCATAVVRVPIAACPSGREELPQIYPASYLDLDAVFYAPFTIDDFPRDVPRRLGFFCGGLVDLPFSLILDTLFLPTDSWRWYQGRGWDDI